MRGKVKQILARSLIYFKADKLGRWLNRRKLLVVMYHGVTSRSYDPPVWTQLPESIFRAHIEFLSRYYFPVSLRQVMAAIAGRQPLPDRAVLLTFDDGLRNNATVVWPILRQFNVPATIFLTVDYIGTDQLLWVDELYFYIVEAARRGINIKLQGSSLAQELFQRGDIWGAYVEIVEAYKRTDRDIRTERLDLLEAEVPLNRTKLNEDFGLLHWDQVRAMHLGGLIDFGVHTATHVILTQMAPVDVHREIFHAKETIEGNLNQSVEAFCYPNGRPDIDFGEEHKAILRQAGYHCAFSTKCALFDPATDDAFSISRVPAGNDASSTPEIMKWNCAGFPG